MEQSGRLRVLLVDDHALFRKGLASLMFSRSDLEIVGEAEDGYEAIEMARMTLPDLILMDVHMPVCDGIEAVKAIKSSSPRIRIVMLSASDDDDDLFTAIRCGADGYLLKNLDPTQFFFILEGVRRGESPLSGILADRILQEFRKTETRQEPPAESTEALTARETEVLELLVMGNSNKEIADALHFSENTVKLHLRNIMEKLHLQNRTQLAVYAVRQGYGSDLLDPKPIG